MRQATLSMLIEEYRSIHGSAGLDEHVAAIRSVHTIRPSEDEHWLLCPHRGPELATINARTAGYGCSTSTVAVYQCTRFYEPVLKQSPARCRDAVAAEILGYTGRTCRECTAVAQAVSL